MKIQIDNSDKKIEFGLCPECGSADLEGDSCDVQDKYAMQNCYCLDCDARWCDQFKIERCWTR